MINISTGILKGMRVSVPAKAKARPTKSGIREALFNIFGQNMQGISFCDLCAGSGAIGFEAASRGAASVMFVEKEERLFYFLNENIIKAQLRLAGNCTLNVFRSGFQQFINNCHTQFDLIYFDPPYSFYKKYFLPDNIANILQPAGFLVLEHNEKNAEKYLMDYEQMLFVKTKIYGGTRLSFFQKKT